MKYMFDGILDFAMFVLICSALISAGLAISLYPRDGIVTWDYAFLVAHALSPIVLVSVLSVFQRIGIRRQDKEIAAWIAELETRKALASGD
jgi:NhaP-type Na+/H+ or K+/H+ antiporter